MREFIPGELEIKCIILELLEGLKFLHSTAKTMHSGLAPEHIYLTKEGKVKIGGMNFAL
jgi:serine/threonine protein kinase